MGYRILRILRKFKGDHPHQVIREGLTLKEAQDHCDDPETSSDTCKKAASKAITKKYGGWFDGYYEEK